jgi:predicted kinase
MPKLIITRGIPGSGKTTLARAWVAEDRANRARVNSDDLRTMVDYGMFVKGVTEPRIHTTRDAAISALLKRGVSVISDDTHLPQRSARDMARLAALAGAEFEVIDLTNVPLDMCITRNYLRTDKEPVPEAVIRDMFNRYVRGKSYPLPLPEEPAAAVAKNELYVPRAGTDWAILVDIDGTVALKGARDAFDETRVHEDRPNLPVIEAIKQEYEAGNKIIFMSGRTEGCLTATQQWLFDNVDVRYEGLYMRPVGDMRKDAVVKRELFDKYVRDAYDVRRVYDDRDQVVAMWRALGLTVMQVAAGNF